MLSLPPQNNKNNIYYIRRYMTALAFGRAEKNKNMVIFFSQRSSERSEDRSVEKLQIWRIRVLYIVGSWSWPFRFSAKKYLWEWSEWPQIWNLSFLPYAGVDLVVGFLIFALYKKFYFIRLILAPHCCEKLPRRGVTEVVGPYFLVFFSVCIR